MTKIILTGCQTFIKGSTMYSKGETYSVTDEKAKALLDLKMDDGKKGYFSLVEVAEESTPAEKPVEKPAEAPKPVESIEGDIKEEDTPDEANVATPAAEVPAATVAPAAPAAAAKPSKKDKATPVTVK